MELVRVRGMLRIRVWVSERGVLEQGEGGGEGMVQGVSGGERVRACGEMGKRGDAQVPRGSLPNTARDA